MGGMLSLDVWTVTKADSSSRRAYSQIDNPFWTGTDLVRFYKLDGDTLTIRTARAENAFDGEEGEFVLVWNKILGNIKPSESMEQRSHTPCTR
jgi:hypothetical protein